MTPKKIMLIDDSVMMRKIIRRMLALDSNLQITSCASNGKDALEELAYERPDLILLDLEMPEMDGLEFLRLMRSKVRAKIVVLSANVGLGSPKAAQALSLGADAIVSKPSGAVSFDLQQVRGAELFTVIYRLLGIKPPSSAEQETDPLNPIGA